MRRVTLYSSARRPGTAGRPEPTRRASDLPVPPFVGLRPAEPPASPADSAPRAARIWRAPRRTLLLAGAGGLLVLLAAVALYGTRTPPPRRITQRDIDAAVLHTLATKSLPSRAAKAYAVIRPSVVEVRGFRDEKDEKGAKAEAGNDVGTGVVIVDKGIILTNLHVVASATRVEVVFADGQESAATVISARPEHDLAVLQATTVPDDLVPATLRSTQGLAPGDEVLAVGFPFGIGPSASAGVISGLRREFWSPKGQRRLTNLIQFDAAANPGNSGGPLVTLDGEVIGIVTGLLNPTSQRVFIGIGFAVPIENAASAVGLSPF
jgi:S1-C subfamily serine protease